MPRLIIRTRYRVHADKSQAPFTETFGLTRGHDEVALDFISLDQRHPGHEDGNTKMGNDHSPVGHSELARPVDDERRSTVAPQFGELLTRLRHRRISKSHGGR